MLNFTDIWDKMEKPTVNCHRKVNSFAIES